MITRYGWLLAVLGAGSIVLGRVFGVLELFVIGAALAVAAGLGLLVVLVRRPRVEVHRWIRPSVLTAGDVGRVEVLVQRVGTGRSPDFELVEPVGANRTARMAVAPLPRDAEVSAGYRIPTERRGVLTIGPLTAPIPNRIQMAAPVSRPRPMPRATKSTRNTMCGMRAAATKP